MRQRHLSQRQHRARRASCLFAEAIAPANRKQERNRIHLLPLQHRRQFLRRILFSPRIQQNQLAARARGQRQNRRLVFQGNSLDLRVSRSTFQIFVSQTLNRRFLRLPDPSHSDFHEISRSTRRQYHVRPKANLVVHPIPLHRCHGLLPNRRPHRLRNPLQHCAKWRRHRACILKNLIRIAQPCPRQVAGRFFHFLKSRGPQNIR